ncbi:response regulator [Amylibacter sp. SFDW26]|uniref:response regulator n=1 Tax=Amylibacter sp. SFDW26 TaxID=2652722 RepID=UPI0012625E27|nr:response regulator [Amylibacter sp. SFDW26]KAB7616233.1 response regulator [Amylibacter sp. SFDW26]
MKILAVDDDNFILNILSTLLAEAGFHSVETCCSAKDALVKIEDETSEFDCFFLDIQMPEMDGIELCKAIKTNKRFTNTPVVMLTALSDRSYIDKAFEAGATDYINKPFDVTTVGIRARIAEKLILAQDILHERTVAPARTTSKKYETTADEPIQYTLASERLFQEPQWFEDIDGAIHYNALTNYLNQLSKSGLNNTNVFAIKVDEAEKINIKSTPDDFLRILNEIAEIIATTLRSKGFFLISYAGGGHFICISHSEFFENEQNAEDLMQDAMNTSTVLYENGEPVNIGISIGTPLKPLTSKHKQTARIFRVSIARSEARYNEKQTASLFITEEPISLSK